MRRRGALAVLAALALGTAAPAGAQQVTTSASLEPATASSPVALRLVADLRGEGTSDLPPTLRGFELAMPAGFAFAGAGAPTCDLKADHPDRCPAGSRLATATIQYTYLAAGLRFPGTTDRAELHRTADGTVALYLHTTEPAEVTLVLDGRVAQAPPFGPTLVMDLAPVTDYAGGQIVVRRMELDFARGSETPAAPAVPAKAKQKTPAKVRCVKAGGKRLSCSRATCVKGRGCRTTFCSGARGRRTCRPLACARDILKPNYAKYKWRCRGVAPQRRARARAAQARPAGTTAFASGACPASGSWTLETRFAFEGQDGTLVRPTQIGCAAPGTTPPPAQPAPALPDPISPLCATLPICP